MVEATDGVTVEAVLAIKEPTRIRIDGASITNVFGNIYSSNCGAAVSTQPGTGSTPVLPQTNPAGEIVLECDADKGEIYVRPVGGLGKPVNLFISSQHATYTLLLRRSDTPADTIVIRDRTLRQATQARADQAEQAARAAAEAYLAARAQGPRPRIDGDLTERFVLRAGHMASTVERLAASVGGAASVDRGHPEVAPHRPAPPATTAIIAPALAWSRSQPTTALALRRLAATTRAPRSARPAPRPRPTTGRGWFPCTRSSPRSTRGR